MRASSVVYASLPAGLFVASSCFVTIDESKIPGMADSMPPSDVAIAPDTADAPTGSPCGWDGGGEIDFEAEVLSQTAVKLLFTVGPAYNVYRYEPGNPACNSDWIVPMCTASYIDDKGDTQTFCYDGPDGSLHDQFQYNYVVTVLGADGGVDPTYPYTLDAGIQTLNLADATPIAAGFASEQPQ
jgi:hypothetical protein